MAAATSLPPDATVAMADGTKKKKDPSLLYRRLSALGRAPEGSVTRTLDKWVKEGRSVCTDELVRYVKELRKYKRHAHALEVTKAPSFYAIPFQLHACIFLPEQRMVCFDYYFTSPVYLQDKFRVAKHYHWPV